MFENDHLAIASVPVQKWGPLYDEKEALKEGTMFVQLNKPFFVTEQEDLGQEKQTKESSKQEDMLLEIQQVSFAVDDVRLYMDMHPEDMGGLALLKKMLLKRKMLLKEYAREFSPLTMDCMAELYEERPDSECYCWQKGPVPWEGVCV